MTDALSLVDEWGPEKIVTVSDSRTGMKGVLVIDNTARGIGKGGTRMSPAVTVSEIARLARVMTYKWATVDLFFGGAKAGIVADPAAPGKERVLRSFARALHNEVPSEYVFGLDMGLTEDDAAIIADELGDRGAAVGTPHALGGVPYDELGVTGHGVAAAARAAAQDAGFPLPGATFAVQGFGAVGAAAARGLCELGATLVAVSTAQGGLHDPAGLDVDVLCALRGTHGDALVSAYPGGDARPLARGEELLVAADIVIPAATQDVIDAELAGRMKARLVVEGANLPTDAAAQRVLAERGVIVVPDFVANAGGVVAAGFAMDARYSPFRPEPSRILDTISERIGHNVTQVLGAARARACTPHDAARALAQDRVREAMRLRGRLPAPA